MAIHGRRLIAAFLCACLVVLTSCTASRDNLADAAPLAPAPDFPAGLQWLNVDHPLTMRDLRGKVVLLDFWTFCCINCMHVIPDLHRLEAKYGNALAVIGVHSAKFATEKGTDNIRAAILRYEVMHPVINDKDFDVWNSFGVSAWPTFVLIDPDGNIVTTHSGEGPYAAFDEKIGELVRQFDGQKKINRAPLALHLEKDKAPPTPLLFPGKIAAAGGKLYVSDSNHNRIVILSEADDSIVDVIGQGAEGLKDGSFTNAQFFRPQGVAVDGNTLYVADTENHAIRKVDLANKTVTTIAGTGHQAMEFNVSGRGTTVDLSSPWDLLVHDGSLYIAMAGMHQVWKLNLTTLDASPFAGSGMEDIADGSLAAAALAQPSGLATDGAQLYSADSETSSIRAIDFDANGSVRTIVGHGLFDFGDIDGDHAATRLQHPLGIAFHDGLLYVADTYNNKIKTIDPATGQSRTFIGTGTTGFADGPANAAQLNEPGGLVFDGGKLYIADTNNNLIRVFDPATHLLSTLTIAQPDKLLAPARPTDFHGTVVTLPEQRVAPGDSSIDVNVEIPHGYAFNAAAPFFAGVSAKDGKVAAVDESWTGRNLMNPAFPLKIPLRLSAGSTQLTVDLIVYYCQTEQESVCLVKRLRYFVPLEVTPQGTTSKVQVDVKIAAP